MDNGLASLLLNGNRPVGGSLPQSLPQLLGVGSPLGAISPTDSYGQQPAPALQPAPWFANPRLPIGAPTPAPAPKPAGAPDWAGKLTPAPRALAAPAYQTNSGTVIQLNKNAPATVLPTGATLDKLIKFADGTGVDSIMLTGGAEKSGHSDHSFHYDDKAIDVGGPVWTPGLNDDNVRKAALAAGFTHGVFEIHPSPTGKGDVRHWHLQVGAGNGLDDKFDLSKHPMQSKDYTKPSNKGQQTAPP